MAALATSNVAANLQLRLSIQKQMAYKFKKVKGSVLEYSNVWGDSVKLNPVKLLDGQSVQTAIQNYAQQNRLDRHLWLIVPKHVHFPRTNYHKY